MMKKLWAMCAYVSVLMMSVSCTENQRAKNFGGTMKVPLPCGQKLFDVTWKDSNLWYAVRPMRQEESPETYTFLESSSFGVAEGTVLFIECK